MERADEQAYRRDRSRHAESHDRADRRLAQDLFGTRRGARSARAAARDRARRKLRRAAAAGVRSVRAVYGRKRRDRCGKGIVARAHRLGEGARRRRGIYGPADSARGQRQCVGQASGARVSKYAEAAAGGFLSLPFRGGWRAQRAGWGGSESKRPHPTLPRKRGRDKKGSKRGGSRQQQASSHHPARMGAGGRRHQGNDLRGGARKPRPQGTAVARGGGARRRREFWRVGACFHHAGIRAFGSGARPRDHSGQHQPRRTRADDHRPQFPDQDQRQYRQFGGDVVGRGGSREDGVGAALGRRHGDGPLHGAQHPQHARMDHPQRALSRSAPCRSIRRWRRSTAIR